MCAGLVEENVAIVAESCAGRRAAVAEVVETQCPVGVGGRVSPAEQLVHVPFGLDGVAEDRVVAVFEAADVERRLFEIGDERRPVEHRHAFEEHDVVVAGDELLVVVERLAGQRIDFWLSRERVNCAAAVGPGSRASRRGTRSWAWPGGWW